MEAAGRTADGQRAPVWVLAGLPLALIAAAIALIAIAGGPSLGDRKGPPVEDLAVERTVLRPGEIELRLRNQGPDAVDVAQVSVNDTFSPFTRDPDEPVGRLGGQTIDIEYAWQEGSPYTISLLTATGATIDHTIDVAVETPESDAGFFGLMALLGTYVGVIPVALGMLFIPLLRVVRPYWIQLLMAATIGLLAFLAVDASLEAIDIGQGAPTAFGGIELLFLGAALSYLVLTAIDRYLRDRQSKARKKGVDGSRLAFMVALGIGLHNLGEGLAIGSAYSIGALALGAFLVVGFAIHNTTEGLAIVAPLAAADEHPGMLRLVGLGVLAGAPAILGALIGASAYNPELSIFLLGLGVGAIVQVIVQLTPTIRDKQGNALHPTSVAGIIAGIAVLYLTSLLVSV